MIRNVALMALGTLLSPSIASAEPISLGAYKIGMSVDEAKAAPIRGLVENDTYSLMCSGEVDAPVYTTAEEKSEGLVDCVASTTGRFKSRSAMYFGNIILDPLLRFNDGKLFEIIIAPHMNWKERFSDAVMAKFGKPTKTAVTAASNAFGASWPKETSVWIMGSQELLIEAPSLSRDKFLVVYRDKPIADRVEARLRAAKTAGAGI